jgi:hypothetical protein
MTTSHTTFQVGRFFEAFKPQRTPTKLPRYKKYNSRKNLDEKKQMSIMNIISIWMEKRHESKISK